MRHVLIARGVVVDNVDKSFGDTRVLRSIDLVVEPGTSLALLGPSGCGKTTLLRVIAGLERPEDGAVEIGDETVAGNDQWLAPERRNVGMVFQDWALFSHLTVGRNVAYGLPRDERDGPRVNESLDMVGLADLADRMPETLSGGQQQRVALARALAPRPRVLLLDEPFSNLDSALRTEVRSEVHRLLSHLDMTSIFVTHDQVEAFVLGDRVAVMRDGQIEQSGTPREIYSTPATPWVASFVGETNLLEATGHGDSAETEIGQVMLSTPATGRCRVLIRPESLRLDAGGSGTVELVEYHGHDSIVTVRLANGNELKIRTPAQQAWASGDAVSVAYAGDAATAFE